MRTADLDLSTLYAVRRPGHGVHPALVLDTARWFEREPNRNNSERPWTLYVRDDGATVGWHEPVGRPGHGVPMVSWVPRALDGGGFGRDEFEALERTTATVRRLWAGARRAVDACQIMTAILGEVGQDAALFLHADLVQPRAIVGPMVAPVAPEPVDRTPAGASIIAAVWSGGARAQTVQHVQHAWGVAARAGSLDWIQVTIAGRDDDGEPLWHIRGLAPAVVADGRAADGRGRFDVSDGSCSIRETADSAEHGWQPADSAEHGWQPADV